jgi:glutathionylspermidine synthase
VAGLVAAHHHQANFTNMSTILDSVKEWERENFSEKFTNDTGLPYPKVKGKDYVLGQTIDLSQTGCSLNQDQFDQLAVNIANLIDETTSKLFQEEKSTLGELCYPVELIDLMKSATSELSYMRLGFIIDMDGKPKLIEVNSQTPSFNYELEGGTDEALQILGKSPRDTKYITNLTQSLKDNLVSCAKSIDKELGDCTIGLLTCDSTEDLYEMNYIKRLIDGLKIAKKSEVCTNLTFDFKQTTGKPFNSDTETEYDILFNWYPLELTHESPYPDGSYFYDLLKKAMESKQTALYNGKSFITQNKYLLVYLQENNLADPSLDDFLTPSYYTQEEISTNGIQSWIGKPIWGRQGAGVFGKQTVLGKTIDFSGDMSDEYYNNQYYIYQQMWSSYPIVINNISYKSTLEKFVYKTADGWKAGGQGMRISEENVIDNYSSWLIVN